MSFDDIIVKITSFDELIHYISNIDTYNEPNTITIYHIHVGSKTFISHYIKHNH